MKQTATANSLQISALYHLYHPRLDYENQSTLHSTLAINRIIEFDQINLTIFHLMNFYSILFVTII